MPQHTLQRVSRRAMLGGLAAGAGSAAPMKLGRRVRVAIIGTEGHTGEITKPLPLLPDVELAAWSNAAKTPSGVKAYSGYQEMLDREKLDVVGVCTDDGARAKAILACLERGLHVVAEKPFAMTLDDHRAVERAAARGKGRFTLMLPLRFTPPFLALRRIVESGEIGEVALVGGQKSYKAGAGTSWRNRKASYSGTIPWVGIHMIDLMRWTSGREFTEVAAFQSRVGFPELGDRENTAAALFRLDNSGVGELRMDYLRPDTAQTHGDDRLRLAGTLGVAEYQYTTGVTIVTSGSKSRVIENLPEEGSLFADFLEHVYLGKPTLLPTADCIRVNLISLKAREAAERAAVLKI